LTETIVNAINLKSSDYKENDKLLTLFTYEKGLTSVRIRGVKKAQAKLKFASEPFCFGQYSLCAGKAGNIVCNCNYNELFYGLRSDIEKYTAAAAMCEYCTLFVQEDQPDTTLFTLLIKCLNVLCYKDIKSGNILLYFLLKALNCSGYDINYNKCCVCGKKITYKAFFSFYNGGFCCGCNPEGFSLMPLAAYKTFKFINNTDLDRLSGIKTDSKNIVYALNLLNSFIEDIAGKKLKSLKNVSNLF